MPRMRGTAGSVAAAPMGVALALWITATAAWGDSFNAPAPPGDPASARYTLDTIYNRLDTGAPGAPSVYSDPTAGPGRSGRSVGEIMGAAPATNANAALRSQVLIGRMFWSLHAGAWGLTNGTMPNIGQQNITPGTNAQTIAAGYHDGTGEVAGDADLKPEYIRAGVTIFGITGTYGEPPVPADMVLIPAGDFVKTDHPDGSSWVTNHISAFYMGRHPMTKALWDQVYAWATNNGYTFDNAGSGKAADHPVHTVMWYDVVKWCNARSEMDGRTPAYYTDAGHTTVYRTGQVNVSNAWVRWDTGYRLPTESEWEKAARGGVEAQRFPWGDLISHDQANFYNDGGEAYQYGTTGPHPDYTAGGTPYTSPVGSFAPNGYGLYDMSGNVLDWCWDWHGAAGGYYVAGSDLRGPDTGSYRVLRGGGWSSYANLGRSAIRYYILPDYDSHGLGFRVALPPGQQ